MTESSHGGESTHLSLLPYVVSSLLGILSVDLEADIGIPVGAGPEYFT
jgi:hypothetical protein